MRDAQGRLVSDLKQDDFVIQEDGRRQSVQLFARAVEPGHNDTLALDLGLLLDTSESMLKMLKLSQEAAQSAGAVTPLGAEATQLYALFNAHGHAGVDFSGIINFLRGDQA